MFELPATQNSRRIRTIRKLRYQYINALNREYRKVRPNFSPSAALPTPENSAAEEVSDVDGTSASTASIRRKRRRKRLLTILGLAGDSDSELSDSALSEDLHDVEDDSEAHKHHHRYHYDTEKEFYSRHEKPQDTFEVWNTDRSRASPMNCHSMSYTDCKRIERVANRRVLAKNTHLAQPTKLSYFAMRNGLDVDAGPSTAFRDIHIHHLSELLHLNVMDGNWERAYKCFTILIRLPGIDVRSMWGIGVRILRALSPRDESLGTSEEFLSWLSGVYTFKSNFNQSMNFSLDPVFRSGSKTHAAKFVITSLWEALFALIAHDDSDYTKHSKTMDHQLLQLIERISEMVLVPPYIEDPEVWYINSICHLIRADTLSERFVSTDSVSLTGLEKDIARNQVTQHLTHAQSCIKTCNSKDNGFYFPYRSIQEQLALFEKRLYIGQTGTGLPVDYGPGGAETLIRSPFSLDTQGIEAVETSSLENEDEEDFFGRTERVHFGFDSDSSNS
ncbi:LADA_0B09824g1_1 [Lachancea dasiensis]|uniref:LADA_0B09824g1_1 n=1 Tax=Lachancea dasiensis TaxID=1072105 RepID=A0A1G4IV52_9SACH|nr:LADA_0B09824g1_1 [Lachancea dasiensis]